jgi:hypothetical protein
MGKLMKDASISNDNDIDGKSDDTQIYDDDAAAN